MDNIIITKASGETEVFSSEKLQSSLMSAGADAELALRIVDEMKDRIYSGMPTKKIYRHAFQLLRKRSRHLAGRYHLKRGIMELGPSGFPFEKYIGELLKFQGYRIRLGEIVKGNCVNHEVDVIAELDEKHFMVECKYHNLLGTTCDVKIPLYVQGRFKDVELAWQQLPTHDSKFHQGWLVTNTRFTKDAIQYGTCVGLHLLGWNYPPNGSLKDQIDTLGLYPLTCLTSLTRHEKQLLLDQKIVLCHDVRLNEGLLVQIGLSPSRVKTVLNESLQLCQQLPKKEPVE